MALPERGSQPSLHACLPSFIPTHPPPYLPVQFSQLESLHAVEDLLSLGQLGEVAPGELGGDVQLAGLLLLHLVVGEGHLPLLGGLQQPLHRVHQGEDLGEAG